MATLSELAVDDWSRQRQIRVIERAFSVCSSLPRDGSNEFALLVVEAMCLIASLVKANGPASVFQRLGGVRQILLNASAEPAGHKDLILSALQTAGFIPSGNAPSADVFSVALPVL